MQWVFEHTSVFARASPAEIGTTQTTSDSNFLQRFSFERRGYLRLLPAYMLSYSYSSLHSDAKRCIHYTETVRDSATASGSRNQHQGAADHVSSSLTHPFPPASIAGGRVSGFAKTLQELWRGSIIARSSASASPFEPAPPWRRPWGPHSPDPIPGTRPPWPSCRRR
jgi:hypothetical protein